MPTKYWFLIIGFFFVQLHISLAQDTLVYTDASRSINPVSYVQYFKDSKHDYTLEDILEMPASAFQKWENSQNINFGFSSATFWLKLNIDNQTPQRLLLTQENAMIHYLNVYILDQNGNINTIKSGSLVDFDTRNIETSLFLFDVGTNPTCVVIEATTKSDFYFPLKLGTPQSSIKELHYYDLFNGLFFGVILCLVLYNIFIFINIREAVYFWYVCYLIISIVMYLRVTGIGFDLFWSAYPYMNGGASSFFNIANLCSAMFSVYFLELKKNMPLIRYFFLGIAVLASSLFLCSIFSPNDQLLKLTWQYANIQAIVQMIVGIYLLIKGYRIAFYYILAFGCVILGHFILSFGRFEVLPFNFYTENAAKFGVMFFGILMSNALAYKLNTHKNEAIKQAKANENLIREQNIVLEKTVAERTQELNTSNKALQKVNDTKDRIFAIIGHDLRKPVLAFRGITQKVNYLLEQKDFNRLYRLGDTIEKEAFSLHRLTDNLLNWALMQRNVMPHHPETLTLKTTIDEVFEMFANAADDKDITLHSNITRGIKVLADANALHTIIRNLVDNAIKYTPNGGQIELLTQSTEASLQIIIKDTGIGMTPEQVDQLFILQKNKSQQGTDGEKGTGLGLHLVDELVKINNGTIEASSQIGVGTSFIIHLPQE